MRSRFKSDAQRKAMFANIGRMIPKDTFSHLRGIVPKVVLSADFSHGPFRPDYDDIIEDSKKPEDKRMIGIGPGSGGGEHSEHWANMNVVPQYYEASDMNLVPYNWLNPMYRAE
jgi:hypothetical protein